MYITFMNNLTIIMYHYVRNLKNSDYPKINGIDIKFFNRQLDYIQSKFNVIGYEDIKNSLLDDKKLPNNACWLTFDDGMSDHFKNVFPILRLRKISAGFPPAKAIEKREMMDVHKIHILMAKKNEEILKELKKFLGKTEYKKSGLNMQKKTI